MVSYEHSSLINKSVSLKNKNIFHYVF